MSHVLERAGFKDPRALAAELGLTLMFKTVHTDRQLSHHIPPQYFHPRTRQGSSGAHFLLAPDTLRVSLRRLNSFALPQLWNAVAYPSPPLLPSSLPPIPQSSLTSFLKSLPTYLHAHSALKLQ